MATLLNDGGWREAALGRTAPAAPTAPQGPASPAAGIDPAAKNLAVNVGAAIGRGMTTSPAGQMAIDVTRELLTTGKVDVLGRARGLGLAAITKGLVNALGAPGAVLGNMLGGATGNMASPEAMAAGATVGGLAGLGSLAGLAVGGPIGAAVGASLAGYFGSRSAATGGIGDAFGSRSFETYRDMLESRHPSMSYNEIDKAVNRGLQEDITDPHSQASLAGPVQKGYSLASFFDKLGITPSTQSIEEHYATVGIPGHVDIDAMMGDREGPQGGGGGDNDSGSSADAGAQSDAQSAENDAQGTEANAENEGW
jgi:hypothetical protein